MADLVTPPSEENQDSVNTVTNPRVVSERKLEGSSNVTSSNLSPGEEQALESHEVIELQTFSERKAWIEEKIKFLEALPPIEVFVGLDALRSSSAEVPGLPTRLELQHWMTEHDAIEKETEIFDTGELKKLRQLTKAATQRNLSAEDTDVIELTLTTIYALDKLLHLLRDRSENLEMMSIRLLWEENRQAGWKEQRQIIEDLRAFSASRACWNSSIYESATIVEDSKGLTRRGSIASLASTASDHIINSPAFSRTNRFKLAELLSRDAAQFSGRVTSLRHGKVAAAGKALDKLIDHSRKPVPDELLDEQDRLEEKCINEMENVSKFTMNLVMQWRKADDIYIETKKDSLAAANLLEEIETAKLHHPTFRQSTTFLSRADTIFKRLTIRGDPSSPNNPFPCPEHFLFPEQKGANESLVKFLSADIAAVNQLARAVNLAATEYKDLHDTVRQVEVLLQAGSELFGRVSASVQKLKDGIPSEDGDGSPPDISSERCLDPTSHSVFIAFLPSLLDETDNCVRCIDEHLREIQSALLALHSPSIDLEFRESAKVNTRALSLLRDDALALRKSVSENLVRLRDCRRISSNIDSNLLLIRSTKIQMVELMERDRWRQQFGGMAAPLTPESPTSHLPLQSTNVEFSQRLSQVANSIKVDISDPLEALSLPPESNLHVSLTAKISVLNRSLDAANQLLSLLGAIRGQASAMSSVRDNYHAIMTRVEDRKIELKGIIDNVLHMRKNQSLPNADDEDSTLSNADVLDLASIQEEVTTFVDGLSRTVPFVARYSAPYPAILKSPVPSNDFNIYSPDETIAIPFDVTSLDSAVRFDSNSYVLRLNGSLETLGHLKAHYDLAVIVKTIDSSLVDVGADIDGVTLSLADEKKLFSTMSRDDVDVIPVFRGIVDSMQTIRANNARIVDAMSLIHESLRNIDQTSQALGSTIWEDLYKPRNDALGQLQTKFKNLEEQVASLFSEVEHAVESERRHQEELKAAEERRIQEEAERVAAEEAARIRMEIERAEEEQRRHLAEQKWAEELEQEAERQRQLKIAAEAQRAEQEAAEAERLRLEELERQVELSRIKAAEQRLAQEEAERTRLDQERISALEKLRITEERLSEERRLNAERELVAIDLANRQRLEMEELVKKQLEIETLAHENANQVEMERAGKHKVEQEAKEHEEQLVRQYTELQQLAEERARRAEANSAEKERAEKEAKKYAELLAVQHAQALKLAEENGLQIERERAEKQRLEEEARRLAQELEAQRIVQANGPQETSHQAEEEDVFGILKSPGVSSAKQQDVIDLQLRLLGLRKRLRSICIAESLIPTRGSTNLPTEEQFQSMDGAFISVSTEIRELPVNVEDKNLNLELRSLRTEMKESEVSLEKIRHLVELSTVVQSCDAALSDLLEHVDSYPMVPLILSSTYKSEPAAAPEEQLSARLSFTKGLIEDMVLKFAVVANDTRAISEHSRIYQTWDELYEMASDRIKGMKSRPSSVTSKISSGRGSNVSTMPPPPAPARGSKKTSSYTHLSVSSISSSQASKGKMLAPPPPTKPRRVVSNINDSASRSTSRISSAATSRSVSGPLNKPLPRPSEVTPRSMSRSSIASTTRSVTGPMNTSLYGTTFASRQRTASLAGNNPPPALSSRRPSLTPRFRLNNENVRGVSPSMSETSSFSHSHSSMGPRSSINSSSWARAPRDSLSFVIPHGVASSQKKAVAPVRKKYVADPKSKLDVAVGDVVNQLEVGINIEGVTESWRDQSGKYWIGNQDPKLCFCRILRSQTVMVRVGGGWTELSRFIKNHFADSFRIAPGLDSPPRPGGQPEKWISSATLLEGRESLSPPRAPRTPEPVSQFVPSFALVTPSGHSPKSLQSSPLSPRSSPLTPIQFMRRAEPSPDPSVSQTLSLLRPATPSKSPHRGRTAIANTTARTSVWRP